MPPYTASGIPYRSSKVHRQDRLLGFTLRLIFFSLVLLILDHGDSGAGL